MELTQNVNDGIPSCKLLVTAFDPFGDLEVNSSAALVSRLSLDHPEIEAVVLPTSYRRGWKLMKELLENHRPSTVLMFGYARSAVGLRLERYAKNSDTAASTDNDGRVGHPVINRRAPTRLESSVPVDAIAEELSSQGLPVSISEDAGGFVCNHIYFATLNALRNRREPTHCLLVHVDDWREKPYAENVVAGASQIISRLCRENPVVSKGRKRVKSRGEIE